MGKVIVCIFFLFVNAIAAELDDRYYPRFHLAAPNGTLGEPSAFCIYNREYHIFYLFKSSTDSSSGEFSWGHAKSSDFFTWEQLPVILQPGLLVTGLLSGSAYVEDDKIYLYYTTNQKVPSILGRSPLLKIQRQALAISSNGLNATKFENNSIIEGTEFQPNFRNPNVFKIDDTYYMVLGNSFQGRGRALLYTSKDKVTWGNATVLFESDGTLGSVWENPDLFELDRQFVLILSVQGIPPRNDDFKNKYQTGYLIGNFNLETKKFEATTPFRELDHGHDFYAAKTTADRRHRYLTAWLDMDGQDYPEGSDGFRGIVSLPRELSISRDNVLLQTPVREADRLDSERLYRGNNKPKEFVRLPDKAADVTIEADSHEELNVIIESDNDSDKVTITYDNKFGTVTLKRGGADGERKAVWKPSGDSYTWRLFIDASCIELFCGDGDVTFSSRFFPEGDVLVRVDKKIKRLTVNALKRTIPPLVDENLQIPRR